MIALIDAGTGGGSAVVNRPDPNPALSAYSEIYAACRARGGTVEQCQLEADPAFTGWDEQQSFLGVPYSGYRMEGPGFAESFGAGVAADVRNLPNVIGGALGDVVEGATGGSVQSLLILGLIGAAIVLAFKLT